MINMDIETIVKDVLEELANSSAKQEPAKEEVIVPRFQNPKAMENMIQKTSARIGIGKSGARLKTKTLLKLRTDQAAAVDSVMLDVSDDYLDRLNLFTAKTKCTSRNEHLTRPDLGREFSEETSKGIREKCLQGPDVQIYVADGLSSKAIEANIDRLMPILTDALKEKGLSIGTPFFVKYGRVATMDHVSKIVNSKVTCVLIGERPGLGSAESMSAYIAYDAYPGMIESNRSVVSNIHKNGLNAVEAGAYLADLIELIFKQKVSGVDLKK
ncbi:Ethanolamine ammonia-lyase light chain [Dethiosulfatibacter aminovorans DSM 17477]|uniref:Ethanolamine ammonia-lyase small subunit n=1 Tax=Dethiosulfatibacter aminovorans DSM 17477 TaxID=1121476 RepID=A0A1M6DQY0_9FIRM|nr:ethanolamine ammonia-lyase subunit EutC [Dethiosulfatibacter aminovorans]SHI75539.1 Ethanolamine ammonia-lyase light chain [Dethiosulfatibacter aminovorans DSM 17477]